MSPNCFVVHNVENDEWDICTESLEEKEKWMCAINAALGVPCLTVHEKKE